MKLQKGYIAGLLSTVICLIIINGSAKGAWVNGSYWADSVVEWEGDIQNYAGQLMISDPDPLIDTTWWILGQSDCFDPPGTFTDYIAGWRHSKTSPSTVGMSLTLNFDNAIMDEIGDDLVIHISSGISASAEVFASSDGLIWENIGTLGSGDSSMRYEYVDFSGVISNVRYLRLGIISTRPNTGRFCFQTQR